MVTFPASCIAFNLARKSRKGYVERECVRTVFVGMCEKDGFKNLVCFSYGEKIILYRTLEDLCICRYALSLST